MAMPCPVGGVPGPNALPQTRCPLSVLEAVWVWVWVCAFTQAAYRGHSTRNNVAKIRASRAEAEKKLADVKARRVWLKKHQGPADAEGGASAAPFTAAVRALCPHICMSIPRPPLNPVRTRCAGEPASSGS